MIDPTHSPDGQAHALLRALAQVLAPYVADQLTEQRRAEWIDQAQSQLGRRRHIAAVRRLISEGSPDARILRRRHLLTASAHERELAALGARSVAKLGERAAEEAEEAEAMAELGLRAVGGGR